jgi:hypothetical protein
MIIFRLQNDGEKTFSHGLEWVSILDSSRPSCNEATDLLKEMVVYNLIRT